MILGGDAAKKHEHQPKARAGSGRGETHQVSRDVWWVVEPPGHQYEVSAGHADPQVLAVEWEPVKLEAARHTDPDAQPHDGLARAGPDEEVALEDLALYAVRNGHHRNQPRLLRHRRSVPSRARHWDALAAAAAPVAHAAALPLLLLLAHCVVIDGADASDRAPVEGEQQQAAPARLVDLVQLQPSPEPGWRQPGLGHCVWAPGQRRSELCEPTCQKLSPVSSKNDGGAAARWTPTDIDRVGIVTAQCGVSSFFEMDTEFGTMFLREPTVASPIQWVTGFELLFGCPITALA